MQDPAREIGEVVQLLTAAINPEIQQAALLRFFAPDAGFKHPLCNVPPGPNSRGQIIGIYQWYRVMSPVLKIETRQITYDESKKQIFIESVQEFQIRWSPFAPVPARVIVHLYLRPSDEDPSQLVISQQEDLYHPEDIIALLVPPLIPAVRFLLRTGAIVSNINARLFGMFGYWAPESKIGTELADTTSVDIPVRSKVANERGLVLDCKSKDYDDRESYTKAIEVSHKPEPTFHSNRAACYMNMQPPQYEKVVEECDVALALDKKYTKALNRRATALEALERYEEAGRDFTAVAILEKFANETSSAAVERVLKKLSTKKAQEILATREPRMPGHSFTSAYFGAFRDRPLPTLPENPSTGDNTLLLSLQALAAQDYKHSLSLVNEAIEQGVSWDAGKAEALNLRGTFKFLVGDSIGARDDFLASVDVVPSWTQSWVKLASVYMELNEPARAFDCFEEAIKHNKDDPDIFYHRGQVLFIMGEFQRAADDYQKSTELDSDFIFSHIQLAVAQYKLSDIGKSMAIFRRTIKQFPNRSEPQNYYGELLLDQGRFEEAIDKFSSAVDLENKKPPPANVLPLVNKGLALFQFKQDIAAAEQCCREALRIDPESDAAVATLAQLSLQQNKIDVALEMFERQAELARTEPELAAALTYKYASANQIDFLKNYPEMASQLGQIARGAMG